MTAQEYRTPILFGLLGAISGVLSTFTLGLPMLYVHALYHGLPPDSLIPLRPALVFGLALVIGASVTVTRHIVPLLVVMASVFLGWWIVMEFADGPTFVNGNVPLQFLHWMGCGFVGALAVAIGGMIAGLYERTWANLLTISLVGAAVGPLTLIQWSDFWPIFIGWQTAVAATVGYAMMRSRHVAPVLQPQ